MKLFLVVVTLAVAQRQDLGGFRDVEVSPNSDSVQFAMRAINKKLALENHDHHNLGLVEVVHAQEQIVEGINLILTLRLTGNYECTVTVWSRPWLETGEPYQVTDGPKCQHGGRSAREASLWTDSKREHLPPDDDAVWESLWEGACQYNNYANSAYAYILGNLSQVLYTEEKVTNGTMYQFYDVPMHPSDCRNKGCANMELLDCYYDDSKGQPLTCRLTVEARYWREEPYELHDLLDLSC